MSNNDMSTEVATTPADDTTDWKAHARKWEERAKASKKEADELRTKVQTYESSLSTSENEMADLKAKVASLSARAAATEREALVARVARDNGITDSEDITLFLTGADEATLTAQAARLATRNAATAKDAAQATEVAQRANVIVPTEGHIHSTPPSAESADLQFAAAIAAELGKAVG